jgi:hypothetical protein
MADIMKSPKEAFGRPLYLICTFIKLQDKKINIKNSFLYIIRKVTKKGFWKVIPFTRASTTSLA